MSAACLAAADNLSEGSKSDGCEGAIPLAIPEKIACSPFYEVGFSLAQPPQKKTRKDKRKYLKISNFNNL